MEVRVYSIFFGPDSLKTAARPPPQPLTPIFTSDFFAFQSRRHFYVVEMKQTSLYFLIDEYNQSVPTCKYKAVSFLDHDIEKGVCTLWSPIFIVFLTKKHI